MAGPVVALVLVSHSGLLSQGAAEVAAQMAPDVAILAAGGTGDGRIGTGFDVIEGAIERALEGGRSAVVLTDLGSAALSAESVLEMAAPADAARVRIVDCPFVEGAVEAAVVAQTGADLRTVVEAAEDAATTFARSADTTTAVPAAPASSVGARAGVSAGSGDGSGDRSGDRSGDASGDSAGGEQLGTVGPTPEGASTEAATGEAMVVGPRAPVDETSPAADPAAQGVDAAWGDHGGVGLAGTAADVTLGTGAATSADHPIGAGATIGAGGPAGAGDARSLGAAGPSGHDQRGGRAAGVPAAKGRAVLRNRLGLHARPAAQLVRTVSAFDALVTVNGVDARSVLALVGLGATGGQEVVVTATGPQARHAVNAVVDELENGFGEA